MEQSDSTGERTFSCDLCQRTFKRVHRLESHLRSHKKWKIKNNRIEDVSNSADTKYQSYLRSQRDKSSKSRTKNVFPSIETDFRSRLRSHKNSDTDDDMYGSGNVSNLKSSGLKLQLWSRNNRKVAKYRTPQVWSFRNTKFQLLNNSLKNRINDDNITDTEQKKMRGTSEDHSDSDGVERQTHALVDESMNKDTTVDILNFMDTKLQSYLCSYKTEESKTKNILNYNNTKLQSPLKRKQQEKFKSKDALTVKDRKSQLENKEITSGILKFTNTEIQPYSCPLENSKIENDAARSVSNIIKVEIQRHPIGRKEHLSKDLLNLENPDLQSNFSSEKEKADCSKLLNSFDVQVKNTSVLYDSVSEDPKDMNSSSGIVELEDMNSLTADEEFLILSAKHTITCDVCGKSFSSKCFLERHLRSHTKEKPYLCEFCGKSFTQRGNLTVHYLIHKNVKNFNCYVCGKKFVQLSTLKAHLPTHNSVMPYSCKQCGKGFVSKSYVERHFLTHSGEKPHVCFVCKKGFAQKGNLTVHLRTHRKNGVYFCNKCDETFKEVNDLSMHVEMHTNDISNRNLQCNDFIEGESSNDFSVTLDDCE